jgi:molybdate transport system substrate-binding protein
MAKLKLLCARSMHKVVDSLADEFARETSHLIEREYGTVGALDAKIAAGESADVLILGLAGIVKLEQTGALVPGSKTPIARTQIGIAIRQGAAAPDVATPDAFKQTLIAARAIAFSDPAVGGTAGVYLKELFDRLGLTDAIAAKGMPQKNGAEVARRVAEGAAEIGMTLMAEIAPIAGVTTSVRCRRRSAMAPAMPPVSARDHLTSTRHAPSSRTSCIPMGARLGKQPASSRRRNRDQLLPSSRRRAITCA